MALLNSKFPISLLAVASVFAFALEATCAEKVKVTYAEPGTETERTKPAARKENEKAFHRGLWEGSFDTASDQAGSVAKQLEDGVDFQCWDQFGPKKDNQGNVVKKGNRQAFDDCRARQARSEKFGKDASSIQSQQNAMSLVSKVSDAAAVAAVGGVIYSELGVKKGNQSDTYESAANIQKVAGKASYITGATDLTLGAYAYVAQKRKLEEMQQTLNGDGRSTDNARLNQSLANAVEATKKAAMSHMMFGAGKMAAGYATMWLAKRSAEQAENMKSLEEMNYLNELAAQQAAATSPTPSVVMASPAPPPVYINNTPVFAMPGSGTQNTGLAQMPGNAPGIGTSSGGASLAMPGARAPASGTGGKGSGLSGGGGGGGSSGASSDGSGASAAADPQDETKSQSQKEALRSFEMGISGGMRHYAGSGGGSGSSSDTPDLAAMMGLGGQPAAKPAATGLSPAQMYSEALEGTEGTEQGSMAGVNGKSQVSLFEITREKLNKMFQVGNVGMPKNVEVRN